MATLIGNYPYSSRLCFRITSLAVSFFLLSTLFGCSSTTKVTGAASNVSGNWYATDLTAVQSSEYPINEVGIDLIDQKGVVTGNVTPHLVGYNFGVCSNVAYNLPVTGTIDDSNHLTLTATDGAVSFKLTADVNSDGTSFSNASYTLTGSEAYTEVSGRSAADSIMANATQSCDNYSGTLNGQLSRPAEHTPEPLLQTAHRSA